MPGVTVRALCGRFPHTVGAGGATGGLAGAGGSGDSGGAPLLESCSPFYPSYSDGRFDQATLEALDCVASHEMTFGQQNLSCVQQIRSCVQHLACRHLDDSGPPAIDRSSLACSEPGYRWTPAPACTPVRVPREEEASGTDDQLIGTWRPCATCPGEEIIEGSGHVGDLVRLEGDGVLEANKGHGPSMLSAPTESPTAGRPPQRWRRPIPILSASATSKASQRSSCRVQMGRDEAGGWVRLASN